MQSSAASPSIISTIAAGPGVLTDAEITTTIHLVELICIFLASLFIVMTPILFAVYEVIDEYSLIGLILMMTTLLMIFLMLRLKQQQPKWILSAVRQHPWSLYLPPIVLLIILIFIVVLNASEGAIVSTLIIVGSGLLLFGVGMLVNRRCRRNVSAVQSSSS